MHGTLEQQVGDEHIRAARIALRNGTEIPLRDVTGHPPPIGTRLRAM
jgi:hypothetical protein